MEYMSAALIFVLLFLLIMVAISRWIFRVNHIVDRLDRIVSLLDKNQTKKPNTFVEGLKQGMSD